MGPEQPGQARADPGGRCGAQAGAGRAAQPRGRQARGQPGDGRRARSPSTQLAESNEPRVPAGRSPTRRPPPRTPTPRPGSSASRSSRSSRRARPTRPRRPPPGVAGHAGRQGRGAGQAGRGQGQDQVEGRGEAGRGHRRRSRAIFAATEADVKKILDGIDPKVEKEFNEGEAAARPTFETYVVGEDVGLQEGPLRRLARRAALGQGQALRDARQGQRVLRGRPRALPQADGRRHLPGRRHRRQRPDRGEEADRDRPDRDRRRTSRACPRTCRRSAPRRRRRSATGSSSSRATSTPSRSRWSTPSPRSTSRRARGSTSGSRSCRPRTRAWSTRRSARSRPSSTRSASSPRCSRTCSPGWPAWSATSSRTRSRFLGNLIDGVKGGILKFKDNILDHLRKGLMSWLFGALAEGGIELPDTFDLKGIIKLLASIFGLTWANIRNRIVKQIGEKAMAAVEKGVEIFQMHRQPGRRRAVGDAAREARRHQGDDPRAGQGLRHHEDHHRRHHLADRPAQPGGGVHQGLQADLRRRDVLREQRQPDR